MYAYAKRLCLAMLAASVIAPAPLLGAPLTLPEAKDEALKSNLNLKIARERAVETELLSREKYTRLLPELKLVGKGSYLDEETAVNVEQGKYGTFPSGPIPANDVKIITEENNGTVSGAVRIEQPLYAGGRYWYTYKEWLSRTDETRWDERQTGEDALFEAETAYIDLLKAEDMAAVARQHEATLRAHLADMEKLFAGGRVSTNDVLKVKVQLSQASIDLIKADNETQVASTRLNLALGRPPGEPVEVQHLKDPAKVSIRPEEAEGVALSNNNALRSARSKRTTANYEKKVADADYHPSIKFITEYVAQSGQPSYPDTQWSATVSMDWPVWNWGGTGHRSDAARAYERQTAHYVKLLEHKIASDVRNALLKVAESDRRIEVGRDRLSQAEENLRITQVGFSGGVRTSTDVLDAETLLSKARSSHLQYVYDAHIARAELRYVMGMMGSDDGLAGTAGKR